MNANWRAHIDIRILAGQSDLVADWEQIKLTVSFELRNDGNVAAQAVAWDMVLLPLIVPLIPHDATPDKIHYPPAPITLLKELCDRAAQSRDALIHLNLSMNPGESREATATCGLGIDLLQGAGTLFEDRSFVPMIYTCTSYVSTGNRSFHQTGRAFQVRVRDQSSPGETRDPVLDMLPISARDLVIVPHDITGVLER